MRKESSMMTRLWITRELSGARGGGGNSHSEGRRGQLSQRGEEGVTLTARGGGGNSHSEGRRGNSHSEGRRG